MAHEKESVMRLAAIQWTPTVGGVETGLKLLEAAAGEAAAAGATMLVAPEMVLSGYVIGANGVREAAEPADGPSLAAAGDIARRAGVGICFGFPELGDDGRVYNAAVLIDALGTRRAVYRKTHLFGSVDRTQFAAGETLSPVIDIDGWGVALAICYDVEFPEVVRAAALAGADVVLVPTANMEPYRSVCTRIVPARAEENGVYVAYCNYVGREASFDYCGLSCIVGPDGADLDRAGAAPALIVADLSKERLETAREAARYLSDRRPELYGAVADV
jgi:predicted amidohydrolase